MYGKKRLLKASQATLLAFFMLFSSVVPAFAEEYEPWYSTHQGYIKPKVEMPINDYSVRDLRFLPLYGNLPSKFDSRKKKPSMVPGFKLSVVKDQWKTGTCWAHSSLGAVEAALGRDDNFSEGHMAYNVRENAYLEGGNDYLSGAYLTRADGPVSESKVPTMSINKHTVNVIRDGEFAKFYDPSLTPMMDADKHKHEVLTGDMIMIGKDEIKDYVYKYGIVVAAYYAGVKEAYDSTSLKNNPDLCYHFPDHEGNTNHSIAIVGYDDNRTITNLNGQKATGAFLVRNSWGTDFGDNGYFWVSYDSFPDDETSAVFTHMSSKKVNVYNDAVVLPLPNETNEPKVTYASLLNRNTTDEEKITDVYLRNWGKGVTDVKIYFSEKDDVNGVTPNAEGITSDDMLIAEKSFDHPGYYNIDVKNAPVLTKDKFILKAVIRNSDNNVAISGSSRRTSSNKSYQYNPYTKTFSTVAFKAGDFETRSEYESQGGCIFALTDIATSTGASIKIKTPPAKTTYLEGEKLDLTGITATITKPDGTTKDVAYGDFSANGITVAPSQGTSLTMSDSKIMLMYKVDNEIRTATQSLNIIPKAALTTVAAINVITPTDKKEYTDTERLDLNGLTVELVRELGENETVAAKDFASKYIFTDPVDNAYLTTSDNKIVITYKNGTNTATTSQAITVRHVRRRGGGGGGGSSHSNKKPAKKPDIKPQPTVPKKPDSPVKEPGLPFVDVKPGSWYYNAVKEAYNNNLMNGMTDTIFDPNGNTTRAMVVQVLYNMSGKPETKTITSMTDVTENNWYQQAVSWAVNNGVAKGMNKNFFGANTPITREQVVTMIYNYAKYSGLDTKVSANISGYSDAYAVSPYAKDAFNWAISNGIISGMGNNTLMPQGFTTRAQLAVILTKYMGL